MNIRSAVYWGTAICLALLYMPLKGVAAEKEPYLAVRTGLKCSACHTNRTGGGGRTDFGSVYGQMEMPMTKRSYLDRAVADYIRLSGDFRWVASGALSGDAPVAAMDLTDANVTLEVRLIPDVLALYVDESLGPNRAGAREAFILMENLPGNGYLKAGKFVLPYGLRLVDDQEYIRERTGFNFASPDQGIEVGFEPGPVSLSLAITNGTQGSGENNDSKQFTGAAVLVYPGFRIGASASWNQGLAGSRSVVGGFGGVNFGKLTLLGEMDIVLDSPDSGSELGQLAAYLEGDYLIRPGLNAKVTYGFLDPDDDIGENARTRMRFGIETFPMQFVQLSAFYTLINDVPQSTTAADRLGVELHLFF